MKSILLTSTALVAFAGAAAAEGHAESGITFGGEATLGYNDAGDLGGGAAGDGFYWDANVAVTMTAVLDNGLTATATFDFDAVDGGTGIDLESGGYVLSLSSDIASLSVGDLDPVAEDRWGGVDGSTVADFNDQDTHFDVAGFEAMLVGEATVAGFTAAVSYGLDSGAGNDLTGETLDAMQIHVAGTFGDFGVELAYQEEFGPTPEIMGIGGSASFAGADIAVSYIDDGTETSTGISASYPVGPVVIGGYYSMNDVAEDNYGLSADYDNGPISVSAAWDVDGGEGGADDVASFEVDASYDVGNGLTVLGGVFGTDVDGDDMGFYAAATYDLGGGAELLVSYADDGDDAVLGEDLGGPEYKEGATIEASFAF
ncbi:porin [Yoonia sp. R2331]|uniref:porin n=1 Tax=Yoonia sp. R2331 TaxID=3237238 RepID=UPI0034E53CE5